MPFETNNHTETAGNADLTSPPSRLGLVKRENVIGSGTGNSPKQMLLFV